MKKSNLVEVVAKKAHLTKNAAKEAMDVFLDELKRLLQKGEKITLSGFGTFKVKKVANKTGRKSPKDPTPMVHKSHRVVRFIVSKTLRKSVK